MQSIEDTIRKYSAELPAGEIAERINESLARTPRLVVTAPPGSGKSTLLPFLVLQGLMQSSVPGKVLLLEPRRLAARQIAMRMADMLGSRPGDTVGYRIRFETKVSANTRIEVITEGILERMLIDDPTLEGYGAVIFDEFHERSMASDLALALTLQAQNLVRPDLRVIIMSATIDTSSISRFLKAPVIESSGFLHEVKILRLPDTDMFNCAVDVAKGVAKALREQQGDILAFLPGKAEIMRCKELLSGLSTEDDKLLIMPLYGLMPPEEQHGVLTPSPQGFRKVVLATPIAETSLTIEGITTVVDSGFCRTLRYNPANSLSRLETVRISLDMARQRSGRSGRLGPGVCYRLWSKPAEGSMKENREPEILSADLAPMVMSVAAWGESHPELLPWITPPPPGALAQAQRLLQNLGAINGQGVITALGRRMAQLPCHPRIAAMLLHSPLNSMKALAADIAAILEEKDLLDSEKDADINTRLIMLRQNRAAKRPGQWRRIAEIARQYRRIVDAPEDNSIPDAMDAGLLLAVAYPRLIAMRGDDGRYRLASGKYVSLGAEDDLARHRFLAVGALDTRIFLAAPLKQEYAEAIAVSFDNLIWDSRAGRIVARSELRIGLLTLQSRPLPSPAVDKIIDTLCKAALKEGLTMFDFNADYRNMLTRIATLASWHPELNLPDVSIEALLACASEWLPQYVEGPVSVSDLRKISMSRVAWQRLSYEVQQAAEKLVPERLRLPSGRSVRIDYRAAASAPVVSARLQDCFGLTQTPRLDNGRHAVLMELLSPGFKPVQLTSDLAGFWSSTYFEVRKELRRRYPKHRWPDNPLQPEKG